MYGVDNGGQIYEDGIPDHIIPLCVIGWDTDLERPAVCMCENAWEPLDRESERAVFRLFADMALEFAPFTLEEDEDEL